MKLLVVVDFQTDFVDGVLGFEDALFLDEVIAKRISEYHQNKDQVIFTLDTHDSDYYKTLESQIIPVLHCIKGTVGHKIYGKTAEEIQDSDIFFEKDTFASIQLAKYLEGKEYESVELVGLVSNICVLANAIMVSSVLRDTEIIVRADCTDSFDKTLHEKCLDIMEGLNITVIR